MMFFSPERIRKDFPFLMKPLTKDLVYFDNACMTLRPTQVLNAMTEYYENFSGCGGRSMHRIGKMVDKKVFDAREQVRRLINCKHEEVIFTRNTTEAINVVANSFADAIVKQDPAVSKHDHKHDHIIVTDKEHNSNLVPWIAKGVRRTIISTKNGFDLTQYKEAVDKKPALVSVVWTSNADGTTNPVKEIIKLAHEQEVPVLLDSAQAVPHTIVDVKKLDVDFLAFSGHKMFGPSGTGVLYGKKGRLAQLAPFITGGDTVKNTTLTSVEWEDIPAKFEAGLQDYAGIIGLGAAADYLRTIGPKTIENHIQMLNSLITKELGSEVKLLGPANAKLRSGIFSFVHEKPHDVALLLDKMQGILVRSGMHCVHSWFNQEKLAGSVRASLYAYNTKEEACKFVSAVKQVLAIVKK